MTAQQRELLRVIETQATDLIREIQTTGTHIEASDTAVRDTMQPLRDLMDGLDRAYAANRAAHARLESFVTRALLINAALAGIMRENGHEQ